MKKFYNNKLTRFASKGALRFVALLCVLIGVSSSAWADIAYLPDPLSLNINNYWHYMQASGHDPIALGEVNTAPTIEDIYVKVGLNTSNNNVCGIKFTIKEGNTMIRDSYLMNNYNKIDNKDTDREYYWTDDIVLPSTTGEHTIELYFWVYGDEGNNWACNETNIYLSNGGSNYKITYTIKGSTSSDKIYVYGDAFGTNDKLECLPTANNPNIVYKELKNWNQWFRFTNSSTDENWDFYKSTEHTKGTSLGVTLGGIPKDGNNLQASNMQENYNTPVFFYYNLSTKEYWLEASKTASYSIEFSDGKKVGCYGVSEGTQCGPHVIELGEGTHQFKVKKSDVVYRYTSAITETDITKQPLTQTDAYTTLTLPKGFYSCSFTTYDENGTIKLSVSCEKLQEPVLIADNPILSANQKSATLTGYLQGTLCIEGDITEYGFKICSGANCIPNENSRTLTSDNRDAISRGGKFTYVAGIDQDLLMGGVKYGYRAYVVINDKTYLSRETGYFQLQDDCVQPQAGSGTITFTIDASLGEDYENDCRLTYGSLQTAINKLRDSYNDLNGYDYVKKSTKNGHNTYNLRQPVVFNVHYYDDTPDDPTKAYCYEGTERAGVSGGGDDSRAAYSLIFKDFNRFDGDDNAVNKANTLTIQGASGSNRPWLHHVILRNSRNVILDNLGIFSDPTNTRKDDALEFDINESSFWDIDLNENLQDANVIVRNCMIGSNGFTGVHASGYDGITFENNEFEAIQNKDNNTIGWGASAKFMMCQNIKFVRNNFRGEHATLVWLQECQKVLFMNNVFWNTNQYNASGCAAIRLVAQYSRDVSNHAFLYNTFYLADNDNTHHYNFFKFDLKSGSSGQTGTNANYKTASIYFKYNNCYSYDEDIEGRSDDPFEGLIGTIDGSENFCPNNFWSVYDQKQNPVPSESGFAFGDACDDGDVNQFVNVKDLVCATTATGPASLKIKGGGALNSGPKLTADDDFFDTGISMSEEELTYDRYNANVRPPEGDWTLGAYQAQNEVEVTKIYWLGLTDQWDDRNNWGYYPEDVVTSNVQNQSVSARSANMQRLSCVNTLSENLIAVIPEQPLVQTATGRQWPQLPESFDDESRAQATITTELPEGIPEAEQVTAGGTTFFAHTIDVEYGAAIKGVEYLKNGDLHYAKAISHFVAPRSQWLLVGTVVKNFDGNGEDTRNLISRDFYQEREPEVYMHYVKDIDTEGNTSWSQTFPDLDAELTPSSIYALNIPDEYGAGKLSAKLYYKYINKDDTKLNHGTEPISYTFEGRFADDNADNADNKMRNYTIEAGKYSLLNNTYPCNLSANAIESETGGQVLFYDYAAGSFKSFSSEEITIKPQQGFAYNHDSNTNLQITKEMLADGNTRTRSTAIQLPVLTLDAHNGNANKGSSTIIIRHDAMQDPYMQAATDAKKVFAPNAGTPELYVMAFDQKLIRTTIASNVKTIPLGIRLLSDMNVRFAISKNNGFEKVILVDAYRQLEHDLTESSFTTELLGAGEIEGRYFLNIVLADDSQYEEDEDITTNIDNVEPAASINIYVNANDNKTIKIIANNTNLQMVYVSDMAGRMVAYEVSGSSTTLRLPVTNGVYVVKVVTDDLTRSEKVILK